MYREISAYAHYVLIKNNSIISRCLHLEDIELRGVINGVRRMTYMYRIWVNNYVPISYVIAFSSQEDLFLFFFFKLYFNLLPL